MSQGITCLHISCLDDCFLLISIPLLPPILSPHAKSEDSLPKYKFYHVTPLLKPFNVFQLRIKTANLNKSWVDWPLLISAASCQCMIPHDIWLQLLWLFFQFLENTMLLIAIRPLHKLSSQPEAHFCLTFTLFILALLKYAFFVKSS